MSHSSERTLHIREGRHCEAISEEHVRAQYHDRLLYWSLRWASRMFQDVLVIIIDSMDKVKTMYPKYRSHRKPAYLDGLVRPRSTLSAALCHGWCTCIYTADEFLSHGASAFCEVLCRALDHVLAISQKTGRPMPRHLVIQSDNTKAQANTSVVFGVSGVLGGWVLLQRR